MANKLIDLSEQNIIKNMKDKDLNYDYLIKKIIYNDSLTKRFVILEEGMNMYSYRIEFLTLIDEEKQEYKWLAPCCSMSHSLFYSEEDALNDLKLTDEYLNNFNKK